MSATLLLAWLVVFAAAPAAKADVSPMAILGVGVGMTLEEAEERLQPLGRSDGREVTAGVKQVWKLEGTDFDWIALRTGGDGRVVWITGHVRSGRELPFDSIDPAPGTATDQMAIWHVQGPHGPQRLTLRGSNRRAQVVTLMAERP